MNMENNKFTISYVYADKPQEFNTSNFRCFIPGKALGRLGYGVSLIPIQLFQENTKDAQEALNRSHVIVVERNYIGDVITQLAYWKVRGRVIILNWDDGYHAIEESNASYNYWKDGIIKVKENEEEKILNVFPHPYNQFIWGLKIGHAATVPSMELKNYYKTYLPVYYVGNYFETQHYINVSKEKRDHIVIGWGGSVSHLQSFRDSGVMKTLKDICEIRPNIKIMICGDKRVFDQIEIPEDKKVFQPYVPYEQWGSIIAKNFDIGIAPLCGLYDEYRSNIKLVEYCLTQTPWIASDGPAYQDLSQYGKLVKNTPDTWAKGLLDTIDNLEDEKVRVKNEPYQFGLNQDIDKNAESIARIYRFIARIHANMDLG